MEKICFSAIGNNLDLQELLRLYGADINATTKEGRSALYYALRRGQEACIVQLVILGAQFSRRDRQTLSVAEMRSLQSLVKPEALNSLLKNAATMRAPVPSSLSSGAANNAGTHALQILALLFHCVKRYARTLYSSASAPGTCRPTHRCHRTRGSNAKQARICNV